MATSKKEDGMLAANTWTNIEALLPTHMPKELHTTTIINETTTGARNRAVKHMRHKCY